MRIETRAYEVSYRMFDVGERITPTSNRCPLEMGEVYVVTGCSSPIHGGDDAVVFVEGRPYGVSTEYLTTVKE